jgi:4-diphosphocytidyl-2C-methyl-D-erythritol kinase
MTVAVRSFAKINLGLYIGAARADGFHDLRTVYQTIALHDLIWVNVGRGRGVPHPCIIHFQTRLRCSSRFGGEVVPPLGRD